MTKLIVSKCNKKRNFVLSSSIIVLKSILRSEFCMKSFVYPAVFMKDSEGVYRVIFPDLELTTDGNLVEEAYLYAKECLTIYFTYCEKHELDYNFPTDFELVRSTLRKDEFAMLIQADIED